MSNHMNGQIEQVRLPDLGDVGDVVIVEWYKSPGDAVCAGEDLVEVETEKTTFLVPAPIDGRMKTRAGSVGDRLRVGDVLGEIEPA